MPKTKSPPRTPQTHFAQVPLKVVKKKLVGEATEKPKVSMPKNVIVERKSEPYTLPAPWTAS